MHVSVFAGIFEIPLVHHKPCCLGQELYRRAIESADSCLQLDPSNAKAALGSWDPSFCALERLGLVFATWAWVFESGTWDMMAPGVKTADDRVEGSNPLDHQPQDLQLMLIPTWLSHLPTIHPGCRVACSGTMYNSAGMGQQGANPQPKPPNR